MLRLGHIEYSNCFPVHARLLEEGTPPDLVIVRGIPSQLNRLLREGGLDVSPSSSIEFARHADRYRILPDFAIASDGAVRSIVFESLRPLSGLDKADVRLTTASATSVVLLRALLELRHGVRPRYRAFDQVRDPDPLETGSDAALYIGDVALRRPTTDARLRFDLGHEWKEWTGLPFVFAVWQASVGPELDGELASLHGRLADSLAWFGEHAPRLARERASAFGLGADLLLGYWNQLKYSLDEGALQGLRRFYELAARLGEVPEAPEPRWTPRGH